MVATLSNNASPRRRRWRRVLTVGAATLAALVVGGLVFLHTSPGRRFALFQLTTLLQQQNIRFSANDLSYNLLDLSVRMNGVQVFSRVAPDLPPFAKIDEVRANLSLAHLLRSRYVLESGEVNGATVHYYVGADGRDNLPRPPHDPSKPSEPLDYLIDQLMVRDTLLRYENREQRIDLLVPLSSIDVDGNPVTDRHAVQLEATAGTAVFQERKAILDRLTGEFDLGEDDVKIARTELTLEGSRVQLAGAITSFDDPVVDLRVRAEVDAARASTLAALKEPVGGALDIDATVSGTMATPTVAGRIAGSGLSFRSLTGVDAVTQASYNMRDRRATFSSLDVRAPWGSVAGEGAVALGGDGETRARLTIARVDAATLMRALHSEYIIASRVDGRIDAAWPGMRYAEASGQAEISLTPTRTGAGRSLLPVAGSVNATGKDGLLQAQLNRVRAMGAELNGRVALSVADAATPKTKTAQRLGGAVQMRVADLGRTLADAETFLGRARGSLTPVRVSGVMQADAQIGGTTRAPAVTAIVASDSLGLGQARGIALQGDISYSPDHVTVERLGLTWNEAAAHATGRVELSGAKRLGFQVSADALQVPELLKAADHTGVPAEGFLSLQGNIAGTLARPTGSVNLRGTGLAAYNEILGDLAADVTLAGRQVVLTQMVLEKPQFDRNGLLDVMGSYELDGGAYTFNVRSTNLELLGLTLPGGETVRGPIELVAAGAGTVAAPTATVDFSAPQLQFKARDFGRIALKALLANDQAAITATADRFGLNAHALVALDTPHPATLKVQIDDLPLAQLPLDLQTPLDGQLRASIEATGNVNEPELGRATAVIESFAGTWNGHAFSVDAPSTVGYAGERLTIERLRLVAQDSTLVISGDLPLTDRAAAGAIAIDGRANLATLVQYAPAESEISGAGELTLKGIIRGTLKAIDPDLDLSVLNGSVVTPQLGPGISNLTIRARVANGEANIGELDANWGVAHIAASGRIPFEVLPALPVDIPRLGGPATFTTSVVNLDPAQIPGAPENLSGRISIEAQIAAAHAELAALEGRIVSPEFEVAFNRLTLAQQAPTTIRIAGGIATVDQLSLAGSVGNLGATGTIGLVGERSVNVDLSGNLNIAVISVLTDAVQAEGDSRLEVAVRGTTAAPDLNGFVDLANASFVVAEPRVAAENVAARVDLTGQRISVERLTGDLNGGSLSGNGFVLLGDGGIADVQLELTTDDVAFDTPLDLRSLSDATIRVARSGETFVVGGQVTIDEAGLTGDINFDEGLLAAMTARKQLDLTAQRSPFLERVRFDVNVDTASPLLIDNNLAQAEVAVDVRVTGTPYEPGIAGRLTVMRDSEITLNERRYEVERGIISFIDERRIVPQFDLLLNTSAASYDVTLAISGTLGETETVLTSDPTLPEPDIMALLVTGRTLDEMRGEEFEVAQEQVLSYLAGRVGSGLGRGLERATGLTEVRIEPQLIANEADPSARLTLGQELTNDLSLVYSSSLTDSNDQIWVAEYDVTRRFESRAVRQSDNSYRMEIRHDVRFGGRQEARRIARERPVVSSVAISGDNVVSEAQLRTLFDIEEGEPYDFFRARNRVERIEEYLREGGWLQSRVRLQRQGNDKAVDVKLSVDTGPRVELTFMGATPPSKVIDEVAMQWNRGVFDAQRLDDSIDALREWLMADRYLQARIEAGIEEAGTNRRLVVFRMERGPRFATVRLAFEGARGVDPKLLGDIINEQNLERQLFTDPTQVTELLERYYREQGYLIAEIQQPVYDFEGSLARVRLNVIEGPRFFVNNVSATGNTVFPSSALFAELPVVKGDPFLPFAAENALAHIRDLYWRHGYNDVRPDYELVLDRGSGRVDVTFTVSEGPKAVIADVRVAGNEKASDRLIREQVEIETEQPLDLSKLAQSRRNLYDTGAFSIVDITREELQTNGSQQQPIRLNVSVREVQPLQLRYGASYDTERGLGGTFDISNHNTLGKARVIGLRARYDGEVREGRIYLSQPSLRYFPVQFTGAVYFFEDRQPPTSITRRFNVDRKGVSVEGETQLRDRYVWSYGYRYERARTRDPELGGIPSETFAVAPLTMTLTREARDEALDATRGSFMSHAFEYSPSWLGADRAYVRYLGQYFHYFPLQRVRRERFTNELIRPRFVFATGARVGLGRGFGDALPTSERFFAGGSTTLRGFEQNAVGPVGAERLPLGGAAMLVLNNELRFPLVNIVDGVIFSDIGNVFPGLSDFTITDLRKSAGLGLRVRTPWFLLRGDYGILLDQREGEQRGRFYFSIGQAF